MRTIDLINGEGFKIVTFPDGEKHIKIDPLNLKDSVSVVCRITNSDDLFILMQLSDILNRLEVHVAELHIKYLMGMRCDRLFSMGEAFTLKIVANVINSFNASTVLVTEPHSLRTLNLIKNCYQEFDIWTDIENIAKNENYTLCFPDAGAAERYEGIEGNGTLIKCRKTRNPETGQLSGFTIDEAIVGPHPENIMIVDDLCDGGGTFLGVAELLRKEFNPNKLILVVTHAVQEEGLKRVAEVFDEVHITDSYRNWDEWSELPDNVNVRFTT